MKPDIAQIVIDYNQDSRQPGDVMLAGVPLLGRVILAAVSEKSLEIAPPPVTVVGDYSPAYRSSVEAVVGQVAPAVVISWRERSGNLPDFGRKISSGRILLITVSGLFVSDLVVSLIKGAGMGDAFATLDPSIWDVGLERAGFWLLTPEGYAGLAMARRISPVQIDLTIANFCAVNDELSVLQAEKWLFRRFGKSTDGFISKYLNRPLSTWVSRRLVRTSVTPDHLTVLTAAFALLMFVVLKAGTPLSVAVGCLLYHVTSIVDGFDGEVARAKFLSTRRGASFDTAVDMATNVLFILGLTLGLAKIHGDQYLVLGGMVVVVAVTSIALMAYVVWKGPKGGSFDVLQLAIRRRLLGVPVLSQMFEVTNVILKRDFFALAFGLLGLIGFAAVIPWLLAAGMVAWLMAIIMAAPLVIGANPAEILPDHIGSMAVPKNTQAPGQTVK
jgi:phosphatidylglycerophosphate synthase